MERKSRKGLGLLLATFGALLAGALVYAHSGKAGHGGHGGHGGPDGMAEHFEAHVRQVLADVDATPEQRSRIDAILGAAEADLQAVHDDHSAMFSGMHDLLTAPAVDRGRIEQLRARHIALLDAASQRCASAVADAAEVLTPEQRAQLGEKMRQRHSGPH